MKQICCLKRGRDGEEIAKWTFVAISMWGAGNYSFLASDARLKGMLLTSRMVYLYLLTLNKSFKVILGIQNFLRKLY